jgi:DNA-directed RNA polymerase subunit M/transcription elongation factor TFIIS
VMICPVCGSKMRHYEHDGTWKCTNVKAHDRIRRRKAGRKKKKKDNGGKPLPGCSSGEERRTGGPEGGISEFPVPTEKRNDGKAH